jgi:hypothetical protein
MEKKTIKLSKTKISIAIGIVIVGIAISVGFNSGNQEPSVIKDPRTVEWRHVHGVGVDPADLSILYIATHGDFYQSRNGAPPVKVDKVRADYMAFNAPPSKDSPLYASGHPSSGGNTGLIKSTDGGVTWQLVSKVLEPPVDFHAMSVSKSDPSVILGFDSAGRGLFKTEDAGVTWDTLSYPEYVSAIAISPTDSKIIFLGTGKGIFHSSDGGKNWEQLSQYKGIAIWALSFDDNSILYSSTSEFGLTKSSDFGKNWDGVVKPEILVTSIATDSVNNLVYVGGYSPDGFQEVYKIFNTGQVQLIGTNKILQ